jgi:capsid protein
MAVLKKDLQSAAASLGLDVSGTKAEIQGRITSFEYNAVVDKGRRQAPKTKRTSEGVVLTDVKRQKLIATAEDQARNMSLIAWMIRKHLDYVSVFNFNFNSDKDDLNTLVRRIFKWHGAPKNFDISGKFGRSEFFRMAEGEKVIAGDVAAIKLDVMKLQAIESDMIAHPKSVPSDVSEEDKLRIKNMSKSGIITGDQGQREQFCICNRGENGKKIVFDHFEEADNMIFDAYWTRYSSQDRGVSPLSTAINTVQDLGESFEANIVKAKLHALFGIAILRNPGGEDGFGGAGGAGDETTSQAEDSTDTHLDLKPNAINILDMNPGEDVKTIESGTPSVEFINASYLYIQLAMLALDIPVTSFDSRRSSFSARIADLNEYEVSVKWKQKKNEYIRKEYSDWVLESIWNDSNSDFKLKDIASKNGMSLRDVQEEVEWIPSGSPWLDKFKQIMGDEKAIELRVDNAVDASRRRGSDVFKNIDKQLEVEKYELEQRQLLNLPDRVAGDPAKYTIVESDNGSEVNEDKS